LGDYMRSTRECAFGQLRPELVQAIRDYLQKHELGTIEADILICCETMSEKTKKGFFRALVSGGSDPIHYTGMLVTPSWLIWATCEAKSGVVVMAARLEDIQVTDFASHLINDTGLEVLGFLSGFAERVSAFIGLGPEPAAQQFRATVKAAVAQGRR
jgi:hypothetical protein